MSIELLKQEYPNTLILENENLNSYTYTKIGGQADVLVIPNHPEEFVSLYQYFQSMSIPITILGNGSNVLISDKGIRGVTFLTTKMNKIIVNQNLIIAESGAVLYDVCSSAQKNGLTNLEFACGIPGTIGGAVYMNAGASGGEIKNVLKEVKLLTDSGTIVTIQNEDLDFNYRYSVLQKRFAIVLQATFELEYGTDTEILGEMNRLIQARKLKQPLEYPSCGSVFKRPVGNFAGKLIQEAGLQGATIGGAQVSKKHAGFIVNIGNCTSVDYLNLVEYVRKKVFDKFNILLEPEVKVLGEQETL